MIGTENYCVSDSFSLKPFFESLGAPLATRRPRIALALLAATVGWAVCLIQFPGRALGYAVSSWILVAYALWLLAELWLPAQRTTSIARVAPD